SGTARGVAGALAADVLLVPGDGVPLRLYAVAAAATEVSREAVVSLDATRPLADVTLDRAPGRPVASGEPAARAVAGPLAAVVAAGLAGGGGMPAPEQLGGGEGALEMPIAYVRDRPQSAGRVGPSQALKHRLADVWVAIPQARAAARYAAACLAAGDPDTP